MSVNDPGKAISVIRFSSLAGEEITRFRAEWLDGDIIPSTKMRMVGQAPTGCYGVRIEEESPLLKKGMTAVFSYEEPGVAAVENIFCVGVKGQAPVIRKLVKNEGRGISSRRKSFMTPTPLHIPDSKVSPIADSTHQRVILKGLDNGDPLMFVPVENVVWMHPLVAILQGQG